MRLLRDADSTDSGTEIIQDVPVIQDDVWSVLHMEASLNQTSVKQMRNTGTIAQRCQACLFTDDGIFYQMLIVCGDEQFGW
jgi:hypothetical protein